MAKRRTYKKRNTRNNRNARNTRNSRNYNKKTNDIDFGNIGTIIFSILIGVLLYTNSGYVGQLLNNILGGMFGTIKYVIPIILFAIGVKVTINNREDLKSKLVQSVIYLYVCL